VRIDWWGEAPERPTDIRKAAGLFRPYRWQGRSVRRAGPSMMNFEKVSSCQKSSYCPVGDGDGSGLTVCSGLVGSGLAVGSGLELGELAGEAAGVALTEGAGVAAG
jgi:hypothetical protein